MPTFSSSVICASRRAARSSGESDVFSHRLSCAEAGEPVLVFSMLFPPLALDTASSQSATPEALQKNTANQQRDGGDQGPRHDQVVGGLRIGPRIEGSDLQIHLRVLLSCLYLPLLHHNGESER